MGTTQTREYVQCYNFDWMLEHIQDTRWRATLRHRWRDGTDLQITANSFSDACEQLHVLDLGRGALLGFSQAIPVDSVELYDAIQAFLAYRARHPNANTNRDLTWYRNSLYLVGLHAAMLGVVKTSDFGAEFVGNYEENINPEERNSKEFIERKEVIRELLDFMNA